MISIIVPVYNAEKYISRCVDSVLRQTYTDWELLLINDGSTDSSEKICLNYAENDKRIKYFSKSNEGPGPTRFFGVNKAQGEYIYFIDSDDYISDIALEILLGNFNEDIDCVIGQHERYSVLSSVAQVSFPTGVVSFCENNKDLIVAIIHAQYGVELWNKLFRAEVVRKSNCIIDIFRVPEFS